MSRRKTGKKRRPHRSARRSPEAVARARFGPSRVPAPVMTRSGDEWKPPVSDYSARKLRALGFDSYSAYLASPHWRAFRGRYEASGRLKACAVCDRTPYELHHHSYARLGHELLTDVTPLCRGCHEAAHRLIGQVVNDRIVRLRNAAEVLADTVMQDHRRAAA